MTSDDRIETVLRAALSARTEQVTVVPDALARIRARTAARRRTWTIAVTSLATAAAAVVTMIAFGHAAPRPDAQVPPATTATATPSPEAAVDSVPVYYTATVAGAPRLFREFHPVVATLPLADQIRVAVAAMLAGAPFDPDYRSAWPATVSLRSLDLPAAAATGGGVVVVDLTGDMPTGTAGAIALQQLVYTVTAVTADHGLQLGGVLVRHDGADYSGGPLTRAPALEILAPVWLISPQQGDTIGSAVDVHVAANLSAAVRLRVRDSVGNTVTDIAVPVAPTPNTGGAVTQSRGESHVPLNLDPGRYTITVTSTSDGQAVSDDHVITVDPGR
jgi:hypothetical protein